MAILADYISLEDLARECGVTRRTVERWAYKVSPGLPIVKLGRMPLIARTDFASWLSARRSVRNEPKRRRQ